MADVRLPGLFTGIDTSALITQLMTIEQRPLQRYQQRETTWQDRKNALSELEADLSSLQTSVKALSDANQLRMFNTASSDTDILTAEASYNAFEGNHTVEINQLANAERWVHSEGLQYKEDLVGAGTFTYSYNHKETSVTTTSTTTLEDFVGLINNDANNPGVTASLLYYNNKYHLVLNGNQAGTDYKISVNPSNTEVWSMKDTFTTKTTGDTATMDTKITDLGQFSGSLTGGEKIHITGTDRYGNAITPVDINVTGSTKLMHLISEINDAFDGKAKAVLENGKIVLTENNYGDSGISINLGWDANGGSSSLTLPGGVADWNVTQGGTSSTPLVGYEQGDFALTQAALDSQIKIDGYPQTAPEAEVQTLSWSGQASGGHFHLIYNGQTTGEIAYNADLTTIQAALLALPNVSAGDITVDLSSNTLTTNNGSMMFNFTEAAGDVGMIAIDTSALTGLSNESFVETTKGDDGWINRSSNTVDDVIPGITFHLHDIGSVEVNLTRDVQAVKDKLNAMITAYNTIVTYVKEKTGYNDTLKTAGILMGDYTVSSIRSQLITPLIARTSGFVTDVDTFLMPGQLGLELDSDGMLSLDSTAFDNAIAKDYLGTLAVIGADKTGSTASNTIRFYGASSTYTSAGAYDVKVTIINHQIHDAQIKLSTESAYRDLTVSGNILTGNSIFDDDGNPLCPENGLQLSVDLSSDGTYGTNSNPIAVRVKQGFTGAMENMLDKILKAATGPLQVDQQSIDDQIKHIQDRITDEQYRLDKKQSRLITQFATMEKTLALLQNQMAALGMKTA